MRGRAAGLLALLAGAALVGGALAAEDPPAGAGAFPSPEMLDELGDQAPPAVEPGRLVAVDRWTLQGPFPEQVGEVPIGEPGPFETALAEVAAERAGLVVVSRAMRCAAREFGLFFVQHGGLPGGALRRFILGRCGVSGGQVGFGYFYDDVPPDASPERVFEVWGSEVRRLVRSGLGTGPRAVGIWFGRNQNRGLVLMTSSQRRARVTPFATTPDESGHVRVRGELLTPAGGISAAVNRGPLGWAECEPAADVTLPRFDVSCPVEPADETAWLAVSVRRPGRLLGESVLDVLTRPAAGEARTWTRRSFGPARPVAGPEEFRSALVERVNELRRGLGHEPLVLAAEESRTAGRLAPVYFGSYLGMAPMEYGDMVALGLMAGWKVKGVIRDASMGGALANGSRDVDRWLAEALSGPGLRSVLLDPARTRLAVGSLLSAEPDDEFVAAVVASYELFGSRDAAALRQDLYQRLDRAYDARDMRFPKRERAIEAVVARELLRAANGEASAEQAFEIAMQESSARLGVPVRGWLLHGGDVEDVPLPEELFSEPAARIAAGVTHVKPPGSAWGRTLVFLVVAPEGRLRTARADHPAQRDARR
jgi:hypothetical protein